jgi:hypothetical protein
MVPLCTNRLKDKKFYILYICCISFVLFAKQAAIISIYNSGSHSVLRGSQEIHDQFLMELWIHICNGYFEIWRFVKRNPGTSLIVDVLVSYNRQNT